MSNFKEELEAERDRLASEEWPCKDGLVLEHDIYCDGFNACAEIYEKRVRKLEEALEGLLGLDGVKFSSHGVVKIARKALQNSKEQK